MNGESGFGAGQQGRVDGKYFHYKDFVDEAMKESQLNSVCVLNIIELNEKDYNDSVSFR